MKKIKIKKKKKKERGQYNYSHVPHHPVATVFSSLPTGFIFIPIPFSQSHVILKQIPRII
jgi:hypothetical protein